MGVDGKGQSYTVSVVCYLNRKGTFGTWHTYECEVNDEVEAWSEFYAHVGYDPEEVEFWCEDEE